jgi:HEAT repeat protein
MRLLFGVIRLFICWFLWLIFGFPSAGRVLIDALSSPDKNIRSIAAMLLVKSGKRAEPLLLEATTRRESLPLVLSVLGSIGDPAMVPHVQQFTEDENPEVTKAAREALKVIRFGANRP